MPDASTWLLALAVLLLVVSYIAGWVLTLFNLPGTWCMVTAAILYAWVVPGDSRLAVGWPTLVTLVGLAVLGEIVETSAGAVGARRAGGSRRGMLYAMAGSLVGALAGAALGTPIPIIGSVVAAILGAAVGAFGGAVLGETAGGRDLTTSWNIGQAAFWGRLAGTVGKLAVATVMVVVGLVALVA